VSRIAERLRALEAEGPRRFARWSPPLWRTAVEGPVSRLAAALGDDDDARRVLEDYLLLVREAVGLQLVSLDDVHRLDPAHPPSAAVPPGFLAVALFEVLPRLLPGASAADRARALAAFWNAGERLARDRSWVDRYLAARLTELDTLQDAGVMLGLLLEEAVDERATCAWKRVARWTSLDPTELDGAFLPGTVSIVAPRVAVVTDRRRPGRSLGVLLRAASSGGPAWLGPIEAPPTVASLAAGQDVANRVGAGVGESDVRSVTALRSGFAIVTQRLSQRIRVAEGA